jgi:hypothetical protein
VDAALAHRPRTSAANGIERRLSPELDPLVIERARLVALLAGNSWDTVAVARELGVHRSTLYRRLKRFGVGLPPIRPGHRTANLRMGGGALIVSAPTNAPSNPMAHRLSSDLRSPTRVDVSGLRAN